MRKSYLIAIIVLALVALYLFDMRGTIETNRDVVEQPRPANWTRARTEEQVRANPDSDTQILFGDFHVHSTFSMDAFLWSIPLFGGDGLHPPADACDYARFCSGLDFYSHNDHAESLTPRHWGMIKDTVRQCNAAAGDPSDPDMVTYLGWEWTQIGRTPETHYGHKNVILRDTEDDRVPARPIGAAGLPEDAMRRDVLTPMESRTAPYLDFPNRDRQQSQTLKQRQLRATPRCPDGVNTRELPRDCAEFAEKPSDLFRKLDEWGFDALVIPHGNTWGFYTPPGASWDKQLTRAQHDPKRQNLVEIMSGHGNIEDYRDWRAVTFDDAGNAVCPEPTADYLPCCARAGQIIRSRCDDPASTECAAAVDKAEQDYLTSGVAGKLVVNDTQPEDWLNCGQCTDCYLPALTHRPALSAQYALTLGNFEERDQDGDPLRFRWGFIGSSDNHSARPGTGFKEVGRHANTDVYGARKQIPHENFIRAAEKVVDHDPGTTKPYDRQAHRFNLLQYSESERLNSFFYTGGLVAVHSAGRDRDSIWNALERRQVYATSGPRILLWFDLLNSGATELPMGSEARISENPKFRVRAVGSFEQLPGCPDHSVEALGDAAINRICAGECYNPGDQRHPITTIEVVRIRPQMEAGEAIGPLIEDPWRRFECPPDPDGLGGCTIEFDDPEFTQTNRETVYYVRALQAPTPTINAANLRCELDEEGQCVSVDPCHGDLRTELDDDCTAPASERAWSSPIYVEPIPGQVSDASAVVRTPTQ